MYTALTGAVKVVLGSFSAYASLGVRMFAATWLAVAFSFFSLLTWVIVLLCCCI
jgi:hypothetical protein